MKKKTRQLLTGLLSVILAASMLQGCSSQSGGSSQAASAQNSEGSREITVAFWDIETLLSGGEQDKLLQKIQEEANVTIKPVNVTWDDYHQKIQLWASSNQLPDLFAIDVVGSSFYYDWTEQGIVQPLPDDLSKWPTLEEYLSAPDIEALRKDDGKLYLIPRSTWDEIKKSSTERKCYYRWDLAQQVGITKEPETYDEFRDMIRRIIAADPEGKDIAGMTTPLVQGLDSFFLPYGVPLGMSDGSGSDFKWIEQDGQLVPAYFAGDMQSAFQLARDMYQEGTIEPDIALAKSQLSEDKFLQGKAAAYYVNINSDILAQRWNETNPDKKFEDCVKLAQPFAGPDGTKTCPVFKTYWSESYIATKDPAKQEAILDLYEYLLKNDTLVRYGFEGEDWHMEDGVIVRDTSAADLAKKYPSSGLSILVQYGWWHNLELTGDPEVDVYKQMDIDFWNQLNEECTIPDYDPSYVNLSTPLKNDFVIKPADDLLNVMTGQEPVEDMLEDLMAKYEKDGLSEMIAEVNEAAGK